MNIILERIRLDEEPILKIGRSLVTALGFESLSLRNKFNSHGKRLLRFISSFGRAQNW